MNDPNEKWLYGTLAGAVHRAKCRARRTGEHWYVFPEYDEQTQSEYSLGAEVDADTFYRGLAPLVMVGPGGEEW